MFTITSEVAKLIQSGASKAASATKVKRQAAEAIAAIGGRGQHFTKEGVKDGLISKETLQGIQALIAKGLLSAAEFNLWAMDSKAAASKGLQSERNALTSEVNSYLASFRKMVESAWVKLNPDAAAAEAEKAKADADPLADEKSGLESAPSAKTLTLETLHKFVVDLTLEISASNDKQISEKRPMLIHALNMLETACL